MAIINQVPFCWKLCNRKTVTTAFVILVVLLLYSSWFQTKMSRLAQNKIDEIVQNVARRRFLDRENVPDREKEPDDQKLNLDLMKNKAKIVNLNRFLEKIENDENDQNNNIVENDDFDKPLGDKREDRPKGLDLYDDEDKNVIENKIVDKTSEPKRKKRLRDIEIYDEEDQNEESLKEKFSKNEILDTKLYLNRKHGIGEKNKEYQNENVIENDILDKTSEPKRKKHPQDIDIYDEEDQNKENLKVSLKEKFPKNEILDTKLYPNRKHGIGEMKKGHRNENVIENEIVDKTSEPRNKKRPQDFDIYDGEDLNEENPMVSLKENKRKLYPNRKHGIGEKNKEHQNENVIENEILDKALEPKRKKRPQDIDLDDEDQNEENPGNRLKDMSAEKRKPKRRLGEIDKGHKNENVIENGNLDKASEPKRKKHPQDIDIYDGEDLNEENPMVSLKENNAENKILDTKLYPNKKHGIGEKNKEHQNENVIENVILDKASEPKRKKRPQDIDLDDEDQNEENPRNSLKDMSAEKRKPKRSLGEMDKGHKNENDIGNENLDKTFEPKKKHPHGLGLSHNEDDQNGEKQGISLKEKSTENEILDTKLYPKRKNKLDLKEDEDIQEMSKELRENYENNVFDRRLLKKKGRWEHMKQIAHNKDNIEKPKNVNVEKLTDDNHEKNKNVNYENSKNNLKLPKFGRDEKYENFEKFKDGNAKLKNPKHLNFEIPKVETSEFKKSSFLREKKNTSISRITKTLKDQMDTERRLPQCIIIGIRKAGTSALITFLELNKNIRTAKKEVHFFDTDENYNKGFDWYKKQMPYSRADQITIEKTPHYLLDDKVPDRIYRMNSSIKLILIVKEPVLRAISEYAQNYARSKKYRQMTFGEYALKRGTGDVNVEYAAINRSIYYQHMPKWLNKFHRKQIHIVDGDELIVNPEIELNKIEKFLGLDLEINSNMFYFNKTKGFKCSRLDELSEPICLGAKKGREHPVVLPSVIKKLQDFYRPLNKKFFKQIDQEFNWP